MEKAKQLVIAFILVIIASVLVVPMFNVVGNELETEKSSVNETPSYINSSGYEVDLVGECSQNYNLYSAYAWIELENTTFNEINDSPLTNAGIFVNALDFSVNDEYVAYGGNDDNVYVHNTNNWSLEQTFTEAGDVDSIDFSNNNYLAYVSGTNIFIRNTTDWTLVNTLTNATSSLYSVVFSPNGDYIAYGGNDNNVYIHNTNDWTLIETIAGNRINSIAFSPDSDYIAYGTADNSVFVHNTNNWSLEQTLTDSTDWIYSVDFSPNGDYIAYGSGDSNIYIHNTNDWTLEQTLSDTTSMINKIDFSSDNDYLAYVSGNNVYIYNTDDWTLKDTLTEATSLIYALAFSPNNNYLGSGTSDSDNAHIYSIDTEFYTELISVPDSDYSITDLGIVYNDTITEYDNTSLSYSCETDTPSWVPAILIVIIAVGIVIYIKRLFD